MFELKYVTKLTDDKDIKSLEGHHLDDEYIHHIVDSDIDIYDKDTNELIISFRKNVLKHNEIAFDNLAKLAGTARGRASSAGQIDPESVYFKKRRPINTKGTQTGYLKPDGTPSKMKINNPVISTPIGYFDSTKKLGLDLPCRLTSHTAKNLVRFESSICYFEDISEWYEKLAPEQFQAQKERIDMSPDYKIGESVFSTITVNRNFRTALHKDKGDFGGYACLSVCEYGSYSGGLFMIPQYGIGINLRQGDMLVAKVSCYHCNSELWTTPEQDTYNNSLEKIFIQSPEVGIIGSQYAFHRISFVSYLREKMIHCEKK